MPLKISYGLDGARKKKISSEKDAAQLEWQRERRERRRGRRNEAGRAKHARGGDTKKRPEKGVGSRTGWQDIKRSLREKAGPETPLENGKQGGERERVRGPRKRRFRRHKNHEKGVRTGRKDNNPSPPLPEKGAGCEGKRGFPAVAELTEGEGRLGYNAGGGERRRGGGGGGDTEAELSPRARPASLPLLPLLQKLRHCGLVQERASVSD